MKFICLLTVLFSALSICAQKPEEILASAKGHSFTVQSLSAEGQKAFTGQAAAIDNIRTQLFSQMLTEMMLVLEAKAAASTPAKLIAAERAKVAEPAAAQIQSIYDANRAALDNKPLDDVKKQIVAFLRREPEQAAIDAYIKLLQTKYKVVFGKNVNAADLKPTDTLATIGTKAITAREFETANRIATNEALHHQYEDIRSDLEGSILSTLVADEAKERNTDAANVIAVEITDKLREYSDEERAGLETALMKRLFAKYDVKVLLKEPETIAQNISTDDDPSTGPVNAPVTIVMFSDFQCPACSRTHPVLKKVIGEFGDKVRFVVRDYPLEQVHENAFNAALAANAAKEAGKFFEYAELLYRNQEALDIASLKKYAADIGLQAKQFELIFNLQRTADEADHPRGGATPPAPEAPGLGADTPRTTLTERAP